METVNDLNPMQREAALHTEGPLLVLAGAGSGKTGTMTHRIAHLIKDKGVDPYNIFAVTFTNKAAAEMRDRVETLVGEGVRMWILTFHAACLRILRKHADLIGYRTDFTIYDPADQKVVAKNCVRELGLDEKRYSPAYVLSVIGKCKERGKTAADFEAEPSGTMQHDSLAEIYRLYEETLKGNNAMDFGDLIMRTVFLLERHPEALAEYTRRFRYIMVDEYQDTDPMQYRFIRLLAGGYGNICVVGDDDQCIYEWRGADITNILNFERDFPGAKVIKLEQNYRSNANILGGANSVIANNAGRKGKALWTEREGGDKIIFERTYDEREEGRYVAREIERCVGDGYSYRDIAVLYRTNAQSRAFEEAFSVARVPYRVLGGVRYYDRKEIKDMLAYMRLVQNQSDDLALVRVINEPRRGVGEKSLAKVRAYADASGQSLFEAFSDEDALMSLSARARAAVISMELAIRRYSDGDHNIQEIYDGLMTDTGYVAALEEQNTVEAERRVENLLEFKSVIMEYEESEPGITLSEFMEKIALISDIDNHDREEDAVALMTLHSAKGLEFPVVFMPGMEDGLFPSGRAIEESGRIDEERRLCYVGMTRAKERLYMIRAQERTLYGRRDMTMESRFLREIDREYLEGAEKIGSDTTDYFHGAMGGGDGFASAEVFRPFDLIGGIRKEVARAHKREDGGGMSGGAPFAAGDKVRHNTFGDGVVLESDGSVVTVMFGSVGKKRLAAGIAPMEKI
ncbi:MAG: UvrD-helicase domain-containing protein [Clostridiales Family XIII bacterium]|jgi:DNA helicase-2/ATP-dependent DNA helicase PcrA|nr:UvrD-helicase domain-containing protein [Clostridiales Family XIII bacterium]